jgi:hypothetical protein
MITPDKLNLYSTKTLEQYIEKYKNVPRFESLPCSLSKVREELQKRENERRENHGK